MENGQSVQVFKKSEKTKKIHFTGNERFKDLEENELLNLAIEKLPSGYNLEIFKTIVRIKDIRENLKRRPRVALQLPDGLMLFSILLADIFETFAECECVILGDITYGACCVDDLGCDSLGCDFIVHYGHSCLIPVTETCVKAMYVFVDIEIDVAHLIETIKFNFTDKQEKLFIMGSIQYNHSVFLTKKQLTAAGYQNISIPQTKPRSHGEILGCTSPNLHFPEEEGVSPSIIFICDGRFHMESAMIANPHLTFYQYDPFTKRFTLEKYDTELMKKNRFEAIEHCKSAKTVGIVFGVLGRQGNPDILNNIIKVLLKRKIAYYVILFSELTDEKLQKFSDCDCFVQIACPRLSIDWGSYFHKPVITPYEAFVAWGGVDWKTNYPMDYYSYEGGEWSNFHNKKPKHLQKANK